MVRSMQHPCFPLVSVYEVPLSTFALVALSITRFIGSEAYLSMILHVPRTISSPRRVSNADRPPTTKVQNDHEIRSAENSGARPCHWFSGWPFPTHAEANTVMASEHESILSRWILRKTARASLENSLGLALSP